MAYVSQELKAKIAPKVKEILAKYGVKGSLAVRHHSTLVLNIKSGKIDFIKSFNEVCSQISRPSHLPFQPAIDNVSVNPYHYKNHFDGKALEFLNEMIPAMNADNWDKSDIQTDYFNVGWYIDVNIGAWNKPYVLTV